MNQGRFNRRHKKQRRPGFPYYSHAEAKFGKEYAIWGSGCESNSRAKVHYVKKAESTPTKDISSDETRGDSDVPTAEIDLKTAIEFPKLEMKKPITVRGDELKEVMGGRSLHSVPRVEHKFRDIAKDIPLPAFLKA
eukprot:TRINITY_DN4432_c0_g1_i1.p1 TRINITY_DN4432_c0_g1~~TRINITY_DN4432_c0_g1_i1.p1  ORF type:complete len:136 (-),score=25.50 TRINITY_DN4432_c0_g1_i1:81-488(-)